jgi:hypothetical protein
MRIEVEDIDDPKGVDIRVMTERFMRANGAAWDRIEEVEADGE